MREMFHRSWMLQAGLCGLAGWLAGCGSGAGGFDAGPELPAGGTFSLAWSLIDDSGTTSCTDVATCCNKLDPNATVFVQASRVGTGGVEVFSCKSAQSTSLATFAPGTYDFTYDLRIPIGNQSTTIATATPQGGVVVESARTVALAPIEFHVNLTGKLVLMLQAGVAGANCAGGEGISGFTISLEHAGGPGDDGCEPVAFTRSTGGTFRADSCTPPVPGPCIESSETLTVAKLPSGPYQIHVRGQNQSGEDCWVNDDLLAVPPEGASLARTLNLARASTAACQ